MELLDDVGLDATASGVATVRRRSWAGSGGVWLLLRVAVRLSGGVSGAARADGFGNPTCIGSSGGRITVRGSSLRVKSDGIWPGEVPTTDGSDMGAPTT